MLSAPPDSWVPPQPPYPLPSSPSWAARTQTFGSKTSFLQTLQRDPFISRHAWIKWWNGKVNLQSWSLCWWLQQYCAILTIGLNVSLFWFSMVGNYQQTMEKVMSTCKADLFATGSTDKCRKLPSLVKLLHDVVRDVRLWNDNQRLSYMLSWCVSRTFST